MANNSKHREQFSTSDRGRFLGDAASYVLRLSHCTEIDRLMTEAIRKGLVRGEYYQMGLADKLVWNVVRHDFNQDRIVAYNIFQHENFKNETQNNLAECTSKEAFEHALKTSLRYYFWSKSEWEVLIAPWCGTKVNAPVKVDAYWQVMMNWHAFLDYVWSSKKIK